MISIESVHKSLTMHTPSYTRTNFCYTWPISMRAVQVKLFYFFCGKKNFFSLCTEIYILRNFWRKYLVYIAFEIISSLSRIIPSNNLAGVFFSRHTKNHNIKCLLSSIWRLKFLSFLRPKYTMLVFASRISIFTLHCVGFKSK